MTMGPVFFAIAAAIIGAAQGSFPQCPCDWPAQQDDFIGGFSSGAGNGGEASSNGVLYTAYPNFGIQGADYFSHEIFAISSLLRGMAQTFMPAPVWNSPAWSGGVVEDVVTLSPVDRSDSMDGLFPMFEITEAEMQLVATYDGIKERIGETNITGTLMDKIMDGSLDYIKCLISTIRPPAADRSGRVPVRPSSSVAQMRAYTFDPANYLVNLKYFAEELSTTYAAAADFTSECQLAVHFVEDYMRLLAGRQTPSPLSSSLERLIEYVDDISFSSLSYAAKQSVLASSALLEYIVLAANNHQGGY